MAFALIGWLVAWSALHTAGTAALKSTCELVTKTEMEAMLGTPMQDPQPQILGMCEYRSVSSHPFKSVHLMLGRAASRQEWEQHERGLDAGLKPVVVPTIGDAALFWSRVADSRLAVIKGTTTLTVLLDVGKMMPTVADTLPIATRLAQTAVKRMP